MGCEVSSGRKRAYCENTTEYWFDCHRAVDRDRCLVLAVPPRLALHALVQERRPGRSCIGSSIRALVFRLFLL